MNQMPMNNNQMPMNNFGQNPQMPPQGFPPMGNMQQPPFPGAVPGGQVPPQQNPRGAKNGKKPAAQKAKKSSNVGWVFLGIFLMLGLIVLGVYLGYRSATKARLAEQDRVNREWAVQQYALAVADEEGGRFEIAKQRLNYIMDVEPSYTAARELYNKVIVEIALKEDATPIPTLAPEPTATQDLRGEDDMFRSIEASIASENWGVAIDQIEALKDKNLSYRPLDVDGLYYIALLKNGAQQIAAGNLESGVYRYTLAEAYGPIDNASNGLRDAARSYLSGAGFWEINWEKAVEYYGYAMQVYPNMRDNASGYSAQERYILASFKLADKYVLSGDYCGAIPYYQQGLALSQMYADYNATATAVYEVCYPPKHEDSSSSSSSDSDDSYAENSSDEFYDPELEDDFASESW